MSPSAGREEGATRHLQLQVAVSNSTPPKQPLAACTAPDMCKTPYAHTDRNTTLIMHYLTAE